jgi:hypothetical protein
MIDLENVKYLFRNINNQLVRFNNKWKFKMN